jgi:hypothetical protein
LSPFSPTQVGQLQTVLESSSRRHEHTLFDLFLAGEFPNCMFASAWSPRQSPRMSSSPPRDLAVLRSPGGRSIGWRFLDKIVQLPVALPALHADRDLSTPEAADLL